jgi:DNA-binding LacI/PurR family transcriptional regulator
MIIIQDVARQAKAALIMVTRFINNSGHRDNESLDQVKIVIAGSVYSPNYKNKKIYFKFLKKPLLVLADITNPFFTAIV